MGGKGGKPPPPIDPVFAAKTQNDQQKEMLTWNRENALDEKNFYGSNITRKDPVTGHYVNETKYRPKVKQLMQADLDRRNQLSGIQGSLIPKIQESMNTQTPLPENISMEGLPDISQNVGDASRQRVEDAMYRRATNRLNPEMDQRFKAMEEQMAARGISAGANPGAYGTAMDRFGRERSDAYRDARDSAILGGGQEQSRLFGLSNTARNTLMGERQQQFGNAMNLFKLAENQRKEPLQNYQWMQGMTQAPGVNFGKGSQVANLQGADMNALMKQQHDQQMGIYNADVAEGNANMQGAIALLGTLGMVGTLI